jgi:hypothetical protein
MHSLRDIYGYCIIPKNTLLYRGHADTSMNDCMFFATKKWVAGVFNQNVQIWKTTTDIELLFLVEHVNHNSWTISALPHLYTNIFPTDRNLNFDDLDIKQRDKNRRDKLVRKLYDAHNIFGWLSSIENKVEMEVCLFDKHANASQLILVDTINKKDKNYFKDSLDRIRIFPSKLFYEVTNKKLSEKEPILSDERNHHKRYDKMMKNWIKEEVQNGMGKAEALHYHFNLRTKLKI